MLEATLSKAEIQRVYRKLASHYDLWGALAESRARRHCLELAGIKNGESVLEVTVGTGLVFAEILKLNSKGRTEGIDLTEEMLERAKTRAEKLVASHCELKTGDAYDLEYPDNSFDVVLNNYMFDLIPNKDFSRILSEFKRVLRNGGRLVLGDPRPMAAESLAVALRHGVRLYDDQVARPPRPSGAQCYPDSAVGVIEWRPRPLLFESANLLLERQVLDDQIAPGTAHGRG